MRGECPPYHGSKSDTAGREEESGDVKKEQGRGESHCPLHAKKCASPPLVPLQRLEEGCQPEVSFERHQVLQEEVMLFQTCNLEICGLTHAISPKMWEKADCEVWPWVEFSR